MRACIFLTVLLAINIGYAMPDPKFKVRCRKILQGSFHVDQFDDWQIVTNSMGSKLSGVSIEKYETSLTNSVPDNFKTKGRMSGSWKLKGGNYWLTCHHFETKMVTVQKLSDDLKACKASETADAVEIVCN